MFGTVQETSCLVLFKRLHVWYCSRDFMFGTVQETSCLVLFKRLHVWYCLRDFMFGKTCSNTNVFHVQTHTV